MLKCSKNNSLLKELLKNWKLKLQKNDLFEKLFLITSKNTDFPLLVLLFLIETLFYMYTTSSITHPQIGNIIFFFNFLSNCLVIYKLHHLKEMGNFDLIIGNFFSFHFQIIILSILKEYPNCFKCSNRNNKASWIQIWNKKFEQIENEFCLKNVGKIGYIQKK